MSDSRDAFEKWYANQPACYKPRIFSQVGFSKYENGGMPDEYRIPEIEAQWRSYQAAEAQAVRACVEICEKRAEGLLSIVGLPVCTSEVVQRDRAKQCTRAAEEIRAAFPHIKE